MDLKQNKLSILCHWQDYPYFAYLYMALTATEHGSSNKWDMVWAPIDITKQPNFGVINHESFVTKLTDYVHRHE
jgi:hypothetical protein